MSWKVIDYVGYLETFPEDEDHMHDHVIWENNGEYLCDCECKPGIKMENGRLLIFHKSFDGREGVEWANEVLKQK
jgi:hypothetical protein